jgi:streptogramin lyase
MTRLNLSGHVAVGEGFVWIATFTNIRKIDPRSNLVVFDIELHADDIAAGEGYVWATAKESSGLGIVTDLLYRIDPATNDPKKLRSLPPRIATPFGLYPGQIATGGGSVWITDAGPNGAAFLLRIDPRSGELLDQINLPDPPDGVAFGEGAVWVRSNGVTPFLFRVDPESDRVTARLPFGEIDSVAAGDGDGWVADLTDNLVVKVDPSSMTNAGLVIGTFHAPEWIAVDPDGVWVWSTEEIAHWPESTP